MERFIAPRSGTAGTFRTNVANGEYVVPKGHIYVLGDNREVSEDSRKFGAVPVDRVLGKIVSY